jgi:integrase
MPKLKDTAVPAYCRHRASGRAYVTLDGQDIYLGKYGTAESKAAYTTQIQEWLANGRKLPVPPEVLTVGELVLSYVKRAKGYYRREDGTSTGEADRIIRELKPLAKLYHKLPAAEFGPVKLQTVRKAMIEAGWVRTSVNHAIGTVKRCFRWGAGNEMLPASIYQALDAVENLKAGRSDAEEGEPVKPVPLPHVEAVVSCVSKVVGAMIRLQLLTGMRSGEMCIMRGTDIDMSGPVWLYTPSTHKTAHRGHKREIPLGPQAQQIIQPFLKLDATAYIFDPREADQERRERRSAGRKTPLNEGNTPGSNVKRKPKRQPGDRYDANSYGRAIDRGCDAAFPPPAELSRLWIGDGEERRLESEGAWRARLGEKRWAALEQWRREHRWHPHQLRHNFATAMRKQFGAEAALTLLGDKSTRMIDLYAEKNHELAMKIAAQVG